jgi:hypothetical protein
VLDGTQRRWWIFNVSASELKVNQGLKRQRGGEAMGLVFWKRRGEGAARWREDESVMRLRPLGGDDTSRGWRWLSWSELADGWTNEMHCKL